MSAVIPLRLLSLLGAGLVLASPRAVLAQFPGSGPPKPAEAGPPADPTKAIQKIEGTRYKLGTMEFDQKTREIRVPCKVNMREGLLEYVLVHETGKVHESLFSTAVKPFELNVVMLLLNWKKSDKFFDFSDPERGGVPVKGAANPPSSHVEVWVEWKNGEEGGELPPGELAAPDRETGEDHRRAVHLHQLPHHAWRGLPGGADGQHPGPVCGSRLPDQQPPRGQ